MPAAFGLLQIRSVIPAHGWMLRISLVDLEAVACPALATGLASATRACMVLPCCVPRRPMAGSSGAPADILIRVVDAPRNHQP